MQRKYLGVLLPSIALGCLLSTPLLSGQPIPLAVLRLLGTISGIGTLMRKSDSELSWLESEQARINQQQDDLSKRYIADTEILEQWVQDESVRLTREANDRIKDIEGQAELLVEQAMSEADLWQSKYLDVMQQLDGYLLPRKPKGVGRVDVIAGRIIDFFYTRGILVDYEDSWTENDYDLIRVRPRIGGKEQLVKLADELQLELLLNRIPVFNISQGCVQIRLETVGKDTRLEPELPQVKEPLPGYLERIIESCSSFRVNGETGSGKSTFVRHLMSLMLGGSSVVLIDPKYPMSEWDIVPRYKGIEEAYEGLCEAAELVESRLAAARDDKDNGRQIREFKPVTYILDEIDWTMTHYGQEAANKLRVTLKVGRALKVCILYIGQTPLASRLKMNRDDFRHSASFFLGENIPAAIEEVCQSSGLKADLLAQYNLRLQEGLRYSMLVKYPGVQPFLSSLPSLNEETVTELQVKNEGVTEVLENVVTLEPIETRLFQELQENLEEKEPTVEVTEEVTGYDLTDPRVEQAVEAMKSGMSKSNVIKYIWHFKGRDYGKGVLLWKDLGLND
jgi:hypothetical protein